MAEQGAAGVRVEGHAVRVQPLKVPNGLGHSLPREAAWQRDYYRKCGGRHRFLGQTKRSGMRRIPEKIESIVGLQCDTLHGTDNVLWMPPPATSRWDASCS
jgi:hypothetical protein